LAVSKQGRKTLISPVLLPRKGGGRGQHLGKKCEKGFLLENKLHQSESKLR
jgi:hypothetical protein